MNLEPSASAFSLSSAALTVPLKPIGLERAAPAFASAGWGHVDPRRRTFGPVLIVVISAAVHLLLAVWVSRARTHEGPPLKLTKHVHITVARPPAPP